MKATAIGKRTLKTNIWQLYTYSLSPVSLLRLFRNVIFLNVYIKCLAKVSQDILWQFSVGINCVYCYRNIFNSSIFLHRGSGLWSIQKIILLLPVFLYVQFVVLMSISRSLSISLDELFSHESNSSRIITVVGGLCLTILRHSADNISFPLVSLDPSGVLLMYTLEGVSSVAFFITAYEESQ